MYYQIKKNPDTTFIIRMVFEYIPRHIIFLRTLNVISSNKHLKDMTMAIADQFIRKEYGDNIEVSKPHIRLFIRIMKIMCEDILCTHNDFTPIRGLSEDQKRFVNMSENFILKYKKETRRMLATSST